MTLNHVGPDERCGVASTDPDRDILADVLKERKNRKIWSELS
jgi:hypothetical protein